MAAMCLLQVNIVRPKFLSAPRSTIHVGMELAVWITSHITRVSVWWATLGTTVPSTLMTARTTCARFESLQVPDMM